MAPVDVEAVRRSTRQPDRLSDARRSVFDYLACITEEGPD